MTFEPKIQPRTHPQPPVAPQLGQISHR